MAVSMPVSIAHICRICTPSLRCTARSLFAMIASTLSVYSDTYVAHSISLRYLRSL